MSKATYHAALERRLETVEIQIAKARERLEEGALADKVSAAGQLELLEERHAALCTKMAELKLDETGDWEDLKASLERDFDALFVDVARWISRH